jgi:pimeloyl-ACP methyl ester carboxylesterase/tetratricopeptide (TPR) repeat protein
MLTTPVQTRATSPVHVVFVHGLFSGPEVWDRFAGLLEQDRGLDAVVHRFAYGSPFIQARPDRQVPEPDDVADHLGTYLERFADSELVVLVGHSQGGLIVQRYLSRTLRAGKGRSLGRVRCVVTYSCPNYGSEFFARTRRRVFRRNEQERQLRVFNRDVMETQRHILSAVVRAPEQSGWQWPIPIYAYGGTSDAVVPARSARGPFEEGGQLPGDHFQVVQPPDHDADSYRVLKERLLTVSQAAAPVTQPAPEPTPQPAAPAARTGPQSPALIVDEEEPPQAPQPPASLMANPVNRQHRARLQGVEREELIRAILSPPPGQARIHVLTGLGGSGKTRVAQEIAKRAGDNRRVWWIQESQISANMREVAGQLGVPSGEAEAAFRGDRSSIDLVWSYLEHCPGPWMLVFDNVDSPDRLGYGNDDVSDGTGWIREPASARGRVVVTSRDLTADEWLPACVVHQVPPLQDNDGAALLLECAPGGGSMEEARLLSKELGGLPLALSGAAAYVKAVREAEFALSESTISGFESYRKAIRARMDAPPGTEASGIDEMLGESIMAEVCGIALDLLAARGFPQAAPLMKLFACLNIAPIPYRLLLKSPQLPGSPLFPEFPAGRRDAVLRELAHLGLIEEVALPDHTAFDLRRGLLLHPLVHGLLRGDGDVRRRRADYYGLNVRVLLHIAKEAPPDNPENWDLWAAVLPHAIEVAKATLNGAGVGDFGVHQNALELARLTARYLIAGGPLLPADDLLRSLIGDCRSYGFAPGDREILGLRHELGRIYLEIGDWAAAERDLKQVVAERERVQGPDAPETLASRHKYARSVLEQSRWDEAAPLLRDVVEAEYALHGPEHSDTLTVRHSLVRALFAMGELAEVEGELRDILAVSLRTRSPHMPETLHIRQTLARSLLELGRHEEGLEEIERALDDTPKGRLDSILSMSLRFTWCKALLLLGRIPEALAETTRLVDDRKRVLGSGHPETLRTLRLLEQVRAIPPSAEGPAGVGLTAEVDEKTT